MITDEKDFQELAQNFYDNSQCNSLEEFDEDINKINLMKTLLFRYDIRGKTNIQLLINHFIAFINCFGNAGEILIKHKMPEEQHKKINTLFMMSGNKKFDGQTEIDEEFFILLKKTLKRGG